MKCGIVTVYNSENCGSFLQAFAMSRALQKEGHEAVFVRQNFGDHSASRRNYLKFQIKAALRRNFAGMKRLKERRRAFCEAVNTLKVVDPSEKFDRCILGSDVIWDVTEPFFRNHHTFFWGTQFDADRVFSYAAALGFAKGDDLKKQTFVADALQKMSCVSVRDIPSREILSPYCEKNIEIVCDPTYLIDREEYDRIAKPTALSNFIFLYCYGNLSEGDRDAIVAFAKEKGLKTVTFGNFNASWCDINLAYDPLLFLSIYDKADYVITNTFHGTVFATVYEKRFAVIKNEKSKIIDVLAMCELSDKMTRSPEDIAAILHSEYRYDVTRRNILDLREKSLAFLRGALGE